MLSGLGSICLNQGQKRRQAWGLNRANKDPEGRVNVAHSRNKPSRQSGGLLENAHCGQVSFKLKLKNLTP